MPYAAVLRRSTGRAVRVVAALVAVSASPAAVPAQQLPFTVPIIIWDSAALAVQQHSYGLAAHGHEQLFCIDDWRRAGVDQGIVRYVVLHTRRALVGAAHRVDDVGAECRGPDGRPMPMLHTHSDGNCQFSPADLATVAARGAPFDGIQCGAHYFVWQSAWQINAIANELEREHARAAHVRQP